MLKKLIDNKKSSFIRIFLFSLCLFIFIPGQSNAYSVIEYESTGCSGNSFYNGYECVGVIQQPNTELLNGEYVCERGYVSYRGECVDDRFVCEEDSFFDYGSLSCKKIVQQTSTSCGLNSYSSGDGKCSCLSGYEWVDKDDPSNLSCKKIVQQTSTSCGLNSYSSGDGKCSCLSGYEWVDKDDPSNLSCKKIVQQTSTSLYYNKELTKKLTVETPSVIVPYKKKEENLLLNLNTDNVLAGKLRGRILLQVESNGEGWYINPENSKRYFLGRPADAFNVMRELGLGISNKDFDSFKGVAPKRLSGRILLKVEDSGKAYYVNPVDLKMYFLGRPSDAFKVMRNLGLGISNKDINKIYIN